MTDSKFSSTMKNGEKYQNKGFDNWCDKLTTWCWPCPPKKYYGIPKYTTDTLFKIPTGSLYFASRRGPLSEASERITGSPYDIIGIIFQSKTRKTEGTHIYTIDPNANKIVTINLADLIKDGNIVRHGILPLKDFEEKDDNRKTHLRNKRTAILCDLFKRYRKFNSQYDAYQNLASIVGFSLSEDTRPKNSLTAAELIGLILFQAGLIWDGRFAAGNKNPVCCFDKCFFQKLAEDCAFKDNEAIVALTTPRNHASVKYNDHYTIRKDRRKDYPNMIYKKSFEKEKQCDPCECDKESKKKFRPKCNPCEHSEESDSEKKSDWFEDRARHIYCKEDEDESDRRVEYNLRRYLDETFDKGYHSEYKNVEKGGEDEDDDEDKYHDYYNSEGENYKRCYYQAKWSKESDCHSEPCEKYVYARTVLFGSLRPVDFLIDYYQSSGIDQNGHTDFKEYLPVTGKRGEAGELVALIHSLANQHTAGDFIDYDINKLNMCWYHDNLIPIELCNFGINTDVHHNEYKNLKDLVRRLDEEFIQKHISCLSGNRLLMICRCTSELSAQLHGLAQECNSMVRYGEKYCHVSDNDEDDHGEYKFKILVDSGDKCATEYVIVLHKYMWGNDWEYVWKDPLNCSQEKYYELCCRIKKLISDLANLKNRIPVSCIILELIVCLVKQAHELYTYVRKCREEKYHKRKEDEDNI